MNTAKFDAILTALMEKQKQAQAEAQAKKNAQTNQTKKTETK